MAYSGTVASGSVIASLQSIGAAGLSAQATAVTATIGGTIGGFVKSYLSEENPSPQVPKEHVQYPTGGASCPLRSAEIPLPVPIELDSKVCQCDNLNQTHYC